MADVTWQDVLDTAVDEADRLEQYTQSQRQKILDAAIARVDEAQFGTDTLRAQSLLAAHFAFSSLQESAGRGTTSSESGGGISVSYTMPVNNPTPDQPWLSTWAGREFNELRKFVSWGFYVE